MSAIEDSFVHLDIITTNANLIRDMIKSCEHEQGCVIELNNKIASLELEIANKRDIIHDHEREIITQRYDYKKLERKLEDGNNDWYFACCGFVLGTIMITSLIWIVGLSIGGVL